MTNTLDIEKLIDSVARRIDDEFEGDFSIDDVEADLSDLRRRLASGWSVERLAEAVVERFEDIAYEVAEWKMVGDCVLWLRVKRDDRECGFIEIDFDELVADYDLPNPYEDEEEDEVA